MSIVQAGLPPVARPSAAAWGELIRAEMRSVIRDTAGLLIPIGMPSLLLVTQGAAASQEILPDTGGRSVYEIFVLPLMLVMVVALVGVVNMPSFLATYRTSGLLKRLATTPAHPAMLLCAQLVVSLAQTVVGVGIALGLSAALFGIVGPAHVWMTVGVFALVCVAMYAIGMLVAAVSPTPNASVAIGLVTFFAIGALGGMLGGAQNLPGPIAEIGRWLPYGAGTHALQLAWIGDPVPWQPLVALAAATVLGGAFAVKFFRWTR
ncbi:MULTISPECIES: ABC transporter permease [unclassified Microbacterium]|uniref:ABC transporter permease n=1 Tax=unclassified Microbacterium TaxID=2609290 RepID=UPI00097F1970|nr:ABC transporter permease [Microbacterium sp. JB110]RCS60524.1 ABC transporter permease [Microbacterium sp. JB110]SJM46518.1 integral membrane protein [Frigoribacterium sp. JB110]